MRFCPLAPDVLPEVPADVAAGAADVTAGRKPCTLLSNDAYVGLHAHPIQGK